MPVILTLEIKEHLHRDGDEDPKFCSHRLLEDGSFMEQMGIYFESFEPEEVYEHWPGKTFSEEENRFHALRSLNWCALMSAIF